MQPNDIRSSLIDTLKIGEHTYKIVASYAEFNNRYDCHVFLYEPNEELSHIKVYEIYNDESFKYIDCRRSGDTIGIIQFQDEDSWINPVKYSIDLAP